MNDRLCLGQIVISGFSVSRRHAYDTENFFLRFPNYKDIFIINKDEVRTMLESQKESKNFLWCKLLTSSGTFLRFGYTR